MILIELQVSHLKLKLLIECIILIAKLVL